MEMQKKRFKKASSYKSLELARTLFSFWDSLVFFPCCQQSHQQTCNPLLACDPPVQKHCSTEHELTNDKVLVYLYPARPEEISVWQHLTLISTGPWQACDQTCPVSYACITEWEAIHPAEVRIHSVCQGNIVLPLASDYSRRRSAGETVKCGWDEWLKCQRQWHRPFRVHTSIFLAS